MKNLTQNRNPKQRHYESTQNELQKEMSDCPLKTNAEQQQFVKQTIKLCLSTPRCGIAPLILNCCPKWGLVVSFKLRSSYRPDKFPVPTEQENSWAPQSVWTLGSKDKCTALAGIQTATPRLASPESSHYSD